MPKDLTGEQIEKRTGLGESLLGYLQEVDWTVEEGRVTKSHKNTHEVVGALNKALLDNGYIGASLHIVTGCKTQAD